MSSNLILKNEIVEKILIKKMSIKFERKTPRRDEI
jgi:hypothetical protein